MNTVELIALVDSLRDDLVEARRYIRKQPTDTAIATDRFRHKIDILIDHCPFIHHAAGRWCGNIIFGVDNIRAAPHILEGYLDAASYELAFLKGQIDRGLVMASED